jgi:hypothetical protein
LLKALRWLRLLLKYASRVDRASETSPRLFLVICAGDMSIDCISCTNNGFPVSVSDFRVLRLARTREWGGSWRREGIAMVGTDGFVVIVAHSSAGTTFDCPNFGMG